MVKWKNYTCSCAEQSNYVNEAEFQEAENNTEAQKLRRVTQEKIELSFSLYRKQFYKITAI